MNLWRVWSWEYGEPFSSGLGRINGRSGKTTSVGVFVNLTLDNFPSTQNCLQNIYNKVNKYLWMRDVQFWSLNLLSRQKMMTCLFREFENFGFSDLWQTRNCLKRRMAHYQRQYIALPGWMLSYWWNYSNDLQYHKHKSVMANWNIWNIYIYWTFYLFPEHIFSSCPNGLPATTAYSWNWLFEWKVSRIRQQQHYYCVLSFLLL